MKHLLIFLVTITLGYSQDSTNAIILGNSFIQRYNGDRIGLGFGDNSYGVKRKEVIDSVGFEGKEKSYAEGHSFKQLIWENHSWVYHYNPFSRWNCAVNHGLAGCPDRWQKGYRICRVCYRKEYFHEERWIEKIKTEIEILNEIVDSLKGVR